MSKFLVEGAELSASSHPRLLKQAEAEAARISEDSHSIQSLAYWVGMNFEAL